PGATKTQTTSAVGAGAVVTAQPPNAATVDSPESAASGSEVLGPAGVTPRSVVEVEPESSHGKPKRLPTGEDPVALGLVSVEGRLSRGELSLAVHDLIELSRRFPIDARVNVRLGRLLHQRA